MSHERILQLQQERGEIVDKMTKINERQFEEKRSLNDEEKQTWEKLDKAQDEKRSQIEMLKKEMALKAELNSIANDKPPVKPNPTGANGEQRTEAEINEERALNGLRNYLMGRPVREDEARALEAGTDIYGGYVVPPISVINKLLKKLDNQVFIRQYATKFQLPQATSMGVPSLDNDPSDCEWTSELKTGSYDSAMSFGGREMKPYPLAKKIMVSTKLLRSAVIDVENLILDRLSYKFAVAEENVFLNGTGVEQPVGIYTASSVGLPTSCDVSEGNTATELKPDCLIAALYEFPAQYRKNLRWGFHRLVLKAIRKMKTGEGQYLWQPGLVADRPDTILGVPFDESEFINSTMTSGKYVGHLGDLSTYWIVDALNQQFQRLNELYAESNRVAYIGRRELDGAPTDVNAIKRLKLA